MNREIKFRAKFIYHNEWLYGDLRHFQGNNVLICEYEGLGGYPVKPETVGQFTGLLDNNGKEIYEGDIIQSFDSNGKPIRHIVEYERTEAKFVVILAERPKYDFGGDISQRWIKEFEKEVIGNIYDNPELLNK